uniref:Uncharacterized protein n=1 Tax=Arundo donax TaxID=35708 RepID=A0A0A9C3J9_ARUDO
MQLCSTSLETKCEP